MRYRKADPFVQNIENNPLPHDRQAQSDGVTPRTATQGGWRDSSLKQRTGDAERLVASHATPAPLEKRISFAGWAIAAVVSVGMWTVLIYLVLTLF